MTGFARVSGRVRDVLSWNLSLKSVNHRFLDLQCACRQAPNHWRCVCAGC